MRALFEYRVPDSLHLIGRDEYLEAIFTRVSGARDECVDTRHDAWSKAEIRQVVESIGGRELLCPRTLKCDQRQLERAVLDFDGSRRVASHPVQILFAIAGVDDDEETLLTPVHNQVVEDPACFIAHEVVLGTPIADPCQVVGEQALQEFKAAIACDPESAHVRDVEQARDLANGQVLVTNRCVLLRQLPTAKVHHASTERDVAFVERCPQRGASRQVRRARRHRRRGRWLPGRSERASLRRTGDARQRPRWRRKACGRPSTRASPRAPGQSGRGEARVSSRALRARSRLQQQRGARLPGPRRLRPRWRRPSVRQCEPRRIARSRTPHCRHMSALLRGGRSSPPGPGPKATCPAHLVWPPGARRVPGAPPRGGPGWRDHPNQHAGAASLRRPGSSLPRNERCASEHPAQPRRRRRRSGARVGLVRKPSWRFYDCRKPLPTVARQANVPRFTPLANERPMLKTCASATCWEQGWLPLRSPSCRRLQVPRRRLTSSRPISTATSTTSWPPISQPPFHAPRPTTPTPCL